MHQNSPAKLSRGEQDSPSFHISRFVRPHNTIMGCTFSQSSVYNCKYILLCSKGIISAHTYVTFHVRPRPLQSTLSHSWLVSHNHVLVCASPSNLGTANSLLAILWLLSLVVCRMFGSGFLLFRGCNGLSYAMNYTEKPMKGDEQGFRAW